MGLVAQASCPMQDTPVLPFTISFYLTFSCSIGLYDWTLCSTLHSLLILPTRFVRPALLILSSQAPSTWQSCWDMDSLSTEYSEDKTMQMPEPLPER
jgi:hypothetical protein